MTGSSAPGGPGRTKGRPAKPRGAAGGGRGRQRWRSSSARRPARRAAGVRCNKQLATQTSTRWACAAAAGRAGTCSRAARAPAAADVRGWAAALGARPMRWGKILERGPPRAHGEAKGRSGGLSSQREPECKLCPSSSGLGAFGRKASRPQNSRTGGDLSLGGERFGETGNYSAEKQNRGVRGTETGPWGVFWRRGHPGWVLRDERDLAEEGEGRAGLEASSLPGRRNSVSKGTEA